MSSTLPSSAARRVNLVLGMLLTAVLATTVQAQPQVLNIVLAGQSTIRSDLRVTAPAELPVMRGSCACLRGATGELIEMVVQDRS